MSENPVSPIRTKKSRTRLLAVGLPLLALLLLYGAGIILMPVAILKNYQARDCAGVLALHKVYANIYPAFVEDASLSPYVKECASYSAAISAEEKGNARQAYDAYQAYLSAYPNGLYPKDAREHSGTALFQIANEQVDQKQYDAALATLNQIVSNYAEVPSASEAWTLIPSVYTSSGTDLREAGNFEQAEQVFSDFQDWALGNQQTEHISHAQSELVQTYWKWGLSYLDQKQYEAALAKLELAVAADPQSKLESAAEVKASQRKVYIDWGNDLLKQGNFEAAIQKYEQAISVASPNDPNATDALANGYIQWASDLQSKEDFMGAIEKLNVAKQAASTDSIKQLVDKAFQETYLAFSKSSGEQARRAMKLTVRAVCENKKKPDLPIFGLDQDSIRIALYGIDAQLPEELIAQTPAQLHYVTCVDVENITVETRGFPISKPVGRFWKVRIVIQKRVQINWKVSLLEIDSNKEYSNLLEGSNPPSFALVDDDDVFEGKPPSIDLLVEWIQSVSK